MGIVKDYDRMCSDIGKSLKGFLRSCPSDVSLMVEGKMLQVHKFVLSARSKYFDNLFSLESTRGVDNQESPTASGSQVIVEKCDVSQSHVQIDIVPLTNNVIEIRNVKMEVVKGVLDYFYEGYYDCHENVETHIKALELAHQFSLDSLERILINHLVKSITMENFPYFFNLLFHYKNDKLKTTCNDFLERNSEEIVASTIFTKLTLVSLLSLLAAENFRADEIDIFRAAERWAGVNKPDKNTVKNIVSKIRLSTISPKTIWEATRYDDMNNSFSFFLTATVLCPGGKIPKRKTQAENCQSLTGNLMIADLFRVVKCSKDLPSINIMDAVQSIVEEDAASKDFRQQQSRSDVSTNVILASEGATITGGLTNNYCYNPMYCLDGNENSYAIVTKKSPLTITLGKPYWLSSLRVKLNAKGNSYIVESSPDGESWQPVGGEAKVKKGKGTVWCAFDMSRRVVLHIRVTVKQVDPQCNGINLYHFESPLLSQANSSLNQGGQHHR